MNNIHLSILGSAQFSNILNELEFDNSLNQNNILNHSNKKISVQILFAENLKIKEAPYLFMWLKEIIKKPQDALL